MKSTLSWTVVKLMGAITTSTVPSLGSSFTQTEKAPVRTVPRLTFTARKQGAHQRSMGWLPGTLMSPTPHLVCLGLCSCFPFSMSPHLSCVLGSLLHLLLCFTVSLLKKNLLLPSCLNFLPPLALLYLITRAHVTLQSSNLYLFF